MGRFQELISRRYNFAGLYATIALAAGLCDVSFLLLGGFAPLQLIAPAIAKSIADGSLFAYDSGGTALTRCQHRPVFSDLPGAGSGPAHRQALSRRVSDSGHRRCLGWRPAFHRD